MPVPSGYVKLGVIGYAERGEYDATAVYYKNQVVHYDEKSYYCKVDGTANKAPTNKNYWGVMAGGGGSIQRTADLMYEGDQLYVPDVIFTTEVITNDQEGE